MQLRRTSCVCLCLSMDMVSVFSVYDLVYFSCRMQHAVHRGKLKPSLVRHQQLPKLLFMVITTIYNFSGLLKLVRCIRFFVFLVEPLATHLRLNAVRKGYGRLGDYLGIAGDMLIGTYHSHTFLGHLAMLCPCFHCHAPSALAG